ncbi:MAG TPA: hypothetical protein VGC42_04710 [Kofleriaceae bacterium]
MIGRSHGQLAISAWLILTTLTACADRPDEPTDLRPDGPPEVLSVLVSNDTSGEGVSEVATFCKLGDAKRPGLVGGSPLGPDQVCPVDLTAGADEATDAVPAGWYVRIQFDELLDPDAAETLVPILDAQGQPTGTYSGTLADTRPVTVMCNGVTIDYDGHYEPGGNSLTWPVGPSLYVAPLDTSAIPTGSACEVSLRSGAVIDKDGNPVPAAQLGPYAFQIAPLAVTATSPDRFDPSDAAAMPATIDVNSPLIVTFNAAIDASSLAPSEVSILEVDGCAATTGTPHPAVIAPAELGAAALTITDADAAPGEAWERGKTFRITTNPGADILDAAGGVGALSGDATLAVCLRTRP